MRHQVRRPAALVAVVLMASMPPVGATFDAATKGSAAKAGAARASAARASGASAANAAAATASGAVRGRSPRGAASITAAQLRDYLTFIASDDLEGRETPSRGLDITARFLALQLARAGVEPGGDNGTFFQKIPLTTRRIDAAKTTAALKARPQEDRTQPDRTPQEQAATQNRATQNRVPLDRTFTYGVDFLANTTAGTAEGPLVYVGHGYVVKAKNLDAYRGIDVAGKVLVAHSGPPEGVSRREIRGASGEQWESPTTYAARHGAKGVIFIPSFDVLARWDTSRATASERGTTTMEGGTPTRPVEASVPAITASPAMLQAIFANEKLAAREIFRRAQANDPADAFALTPAKQVQFTVATVAHSQPTQNVVAIVRGSDPVLRQEYVALGAHYDHVGVGTPTPGTSSATGPASTGSASAGAAAADIIYNGADDDGSGTTALLAMAETIARLEPRPKRSVLFVWHAGEEHGLWGSAYFAQHPVVPIEKIVAQLNIDMIGRSRAPDDQAPENALLTGPNEIYVIGSKMMSSALGELSERVNASYLKLSFNYRYDDPTDASRLFFRSDHYNYARKGVPIIFYFSGLHADYHQPSDSVEKIDFAKMERVARMIYATALALADAPTRPRVDRTLPRELTEP